MNIDELSKATNIAELLDDDTLAMIANQVVSGYEYDESTRAKWKELNNKAMEMAKQAIETKDHPWPNASNVKYPLITKASVDFAARTYPELVKNSKIARGSVIGADPDGKKAERAQRVGDFMSYQLLQQCDEWEEGLDSSLHTLAIVGTIFKKTYYDPIKKRPVSIMCNPDKVVVDYNAPSLKAARRITHIMHVYINDIVEQIRYGHYSDIDMGHLLSSDNSDSSDDPIVELIEQHCYLDLDDDGYKEPYIVVLHRSSMQVLSIKPRFASIERDKDENKVYCIEPEHWFTDYHFIRNHDGGFYSLGFGILLLPLNSSINTIINQLIDSGTLNNQQSGFIGRGIRLRGGDIRPKMGEFKVLDASSGTDLQKNIVPLPTKEPSMVLFQMLGLLIQSGKELTSSSEVTSGQAPPSNVPAAAWMSSVDNALKVLNAINKRIYKSLASELQKIYYINQKHLTNSEYRKVLDIPNVNVKDDFDSESVDIIPVADPSLATTTQRVAKIQAIMSMPVPNQAALTKLYLEALEVDPKVIETLLTPPQDQGPPPDVMESMAKVKLMEAQAQEIMQKLQFSANELLTRTRQLDIQEFDTKARADESAARILKMHHDMQISNAKVQIVADKEDHKATMSEIKQAHMKEMDAAKFVADSHEAANRLELEAASTASKHAIEAHKIDVEAAAKAAELQTKLKLGEKKDS